jgi:sugar-specific transcriptional regulator TrmB
LSLERIIKTLVSLGLSQTDARVYINLAAEGPATARDMINSLTIKKRQIYRSLERLQNKGIAICNNDFPSEFSVIAFEEVLNLLLELKEEQARSLQASKTELILDFRAEKEKHRQDK